MALGLKNPLVFFQYYKETCLEDFQLKAATDMGALLHRRVLRRHLAL